jgi:hypothetical protein
MSGTRCKICNSPDVLGINKMISEEIPLLKIAERSGISTASIRRHKFNHMNIEKPSQFGAGETSGTLDFSDSSAAAQLEQLKYITQRLLATVTASKDVKIPQAIALMKEARAQLADIQKSAPKKQLQERLEDNGDWINFRDIVLDTLFDFPEAKTAVLKAIRARGSVATLPQAPPAPG